MTTETRDLPEFTSIAMEGHGDMTLVHGETPSIVIDTDPETLAHLKVEVENGRLILGMKSWLDYLFHSWKKVTYIVTYTHLEAVSVSGSAKVVADEITSDRFKFHVSGSGNFKTDQLNVKDLDVHISGSGHIELGGAAQNEEIRISGSGKVVARDLPCQSASVKVSGSGELILNVSEKLDVSISGSGSVRYLGSPKVQQSISGSGSIKQL